VAATTAAAATSAPGTSSNDLTDRSLGVMLDAVADLARIYRQHPDAKVEIPVEKKTFTMEQLLREQIRELRACGRQGKQQAGVIEAALKQQQAAS
jgi:hypothetical protein